MCGNGLCERELLEDCLTCPQDCDDDPCGIFSFRLSFILCINDFFI